MPADPAQPGPRRLLDSTDLPEKGSKEVVLTPGDRDGSSVVVIRFEGRVYGYRNLCPHLRVPLNWRPDGFWTMDRTALICAMHGALFHPDSGKCYHGPCSGRSLESIALCERDGAIWLNEPSS